LVGENEGVNKREKGKVWEDFAAKHLEHKGYKVLFRNWTCRWGEIDLVCFDPSEKCVVFVEVKFRDGWFGDAYESVGFYKIRALKRSAGFFILKEKPIWKDFRFDVVAITKVRGTVEVEHFPAVDQEW